jgi:hypothetical protein
MYRGQVVLGRMKFTQQSHFCQSFLLSLPKQLDLFLVKPVYLGGY